MTAPAGDRVFGTSPCRCCGPTCWSRCCCASIFEFRAFDNIYALTGGGPANATMVLSMFTYLTSFVRFDFGLGAAASWMMLLISMLTCLFFIATIRRRDAH